MSRVKVADLLGLVMLLAYCAGVPIALLLVATS